MEAMAADDSAPLTTSGDSGTISATAALSLRVKPLTPRMVANPGYLSTGMLRGTQSTVSFDVTNTGGAATGPLQVQLPEGVTWLSLGSPETIASLAPGEKTTITLILNPPEDLPLQIYQGSINVVGAGNYVTARYQFRATSEAVGDVKVTVTDEYTYFAADKPNVAGAKVQLLDVYTGQVVASDVTDETGIVTFTGIAEGPYNLQVSALKHETVRQTVYVTPGGLVDQEIFLHRQAVSYTWTVVPTEIQDHYTIQLQTTFETEVPMPVVTVDQPFLMPMVLPGYATQFTLTLRNHGLINAEHVQVKAPSDPDFVITPLIDEIPVLAAKSEVTIPCTIRLSDAAMARYSAGEGDILSEGAGSTITKCLGLGVVYTYECKNGQWQQVPVQLAATVGCLEGFKDFAGSVSEYLLERALGNLLGVGCDVISMALDCYTAATGKELLSDCETAILTTACKALVGGVAGGVAGALAGAASNWADILACLCSLNWGGSSSSTGSPGGGGGGWGWGGDGSGPGSAYGTPVGYSTTSNNCGGTSSASTDDVITSGDTPLTTQAGGVCAEVRMRLEQEAVITRTAFLGTLEVNNGRTDTTLTNVGLTLDIRDADGNAANDMFVVRGPDVQNVNGTVNDWTIGPDTTGIIQYTFVPTNDAAPDAPEYYNIGGILHYVDNGTAVDVPLLPARITVYPEAKLVLDYFWQRDVYADDPFTEVVEPSEPFALGLEVLNVGKGTAGDLTITAAQPKIIENEKGLLIDFKILSSQIGATAGSPSLTVDLGTIAPGETKTAQWNMISSLQGKFKDFSATFEHKDDNGDMRTSLIQEVNLHELTRSVRVTTPTEDGIPDYLVNDVPDENNLPDTLYMSTGGLSEVTLATDMAFSGGGLTRTLTADMQSGWSYIQVADVLPGYELRSVKRSDGKVIPLDGMAWRTNRTFKAGEPGVTYENLFHLLDYNDTGSSQVTYTLNYSIVDHVPPEIVTLTGAVGLQTNPVDAVQVEFSELIDEGTLTAADIQLTRNDIAVDVPDLTVEYLYGAVYRISGLHSATADDGNYHLTLDAHGISDLAGNSGTNTASLDWAMSSGNAPAILNIQPVTPYYRNTTVDTLDVTFSEPMDASSIDWTDLTLTRDGVEVTLNSSVTVVQTADDATAFRIVGLSAFTAEAGDYVLTVRADGTQDSGGHSGTGQFSRSWVVDLTGPTLTAIEHLSTNPRNIVVMSLDVGFSEPIDATTFDWHDITLTRTDGGTTSDNLITDEVTVEQVDANTWRIKGFNWKVGLNGTYTLTVNGAGITDLAGNAGSGSVAETWVMDIVDPAAPTHVGLGPDNGISDSDLLTNTLTLTLTGDLPESGLSVRLTDMTTDKELGYATVTGTTFSGTFTLSGPGLHKIRVRVADAASNLSPDTFLEVFVDTTAPGVTSISTISPNPRTTALDTIDITLDEAIIPGGFTFADLALTRDGFDVPLDSTVTVAKDGANDKLYHVSGLAGFTGTDGDYQLTVSATGLSDLAGNPGKGSRSVTWSKEAVLPTRIRGMVYEDLDGSGSYNPAVYNPELGLAGRELRAFLDANDNGQLDGDETYVYTTSVADGSYTFNGLSAGKYRVEQILPTGWILTAPGSGTYTIIMTEGTTATGANFGDFKTGTISGLKFNDLDSDGMQDADESPLAGWTIFLDANGNGTLDAAEASVVTGDDGAFSFSNIGPGIVKIEEVAQAGWQRTTPNAAYTVKSGFVLTTTIGNSQLGVITGHKYNDLDGDGVYDVGEPGIQGWTIFLDNNANGVLDVGERSTVTDANGYYSFTALLQGQYTVAEVQREGWDQTSPLPASPGAVNVSTTGSTIALESDCNCGGNWATGAGVSSTDYGVVAINTALETVGITDMRQNGYSTLDGRGIATVIIDTGIDLDNSVFGPDLNGDGIADRIVYQYDFADNDSDATDYNGHGSHIASLVGSQHSLYPGVAPGSDIIALKVFKDSGQGYFGYLEKALQWVLANHEAYHVGVVNLSLGDGGNWTDQLSRYGIGDELAALAQTDVIVIAAAGNNYYQFGTMGVSYPASDPAAIAVGATWAADFGGPWSVNTGATSYSTGIDEICAFSQRDDELLDTFAPGARFNGADPNGGIRTMQGTSQAAAFVSGAATLAQQIARDTLGRGLTTGEFAALLRNTGDLIMDGDDEIDNVPNTGLQYPRLNFEKLAAAIVALDQTDSGGGTGTGNNGTGQTIQLAAAGVYTVTVNPGVTLANLDFLNYNSRPTVVERTVADGAYAVDSFALRFSEAMNIQSLIDDGTIASAVYLMRLTADGRVAETLPLTAGQFSYDAGTFTMTWNLNGETGGTDTLAAGRYTIQLDSAKIKDATGSRLLGGGGGIAWLNMPTFDVAQNIKSSGTNLDVGDYSVPTMADWNGDGLADLIVGEKTADSLGKVRVYLNTGSAAAPVFGTYAYVQAAGSDLSVPATGCLGAFPRVFDWNADGKKDLIIGLADGTIKVYLNGGTATAPSFTSGTFIQVGAAGSKATLDVGDRAAFDLADWNNDGLTDLVVGALDGQVRVYLNQGTAGNPDFLSATLLQEGLTYLTVPTGRSSVDVFDLNHDGKKDLILGNTEGQVIYYMNIGTDAAPVFSGSQLIAAGGLVIDLLEQPRSREFICDYNNDGVPDILLGSRDGLVRLYVGHINPDDYGTTFTVSHVGNTAPVAGDDAASGNEDTAITGNVLANDTDANGDPLTAVLESSPAHGSLTLNSDGSFTYTPTANYNGADSFTYRAYDNTDYSNAATVSITISPVNDAPVAQNDNYTVNQDAILNVSAAGGVLANDTDIDSATITAVGVSDPAHGTLTLNADGSFVYTPEAGYYGPDSFTYRAYDGTDYSNETTVSIAVHAFLNQAPVAAADAYTTDEDTALNMPVAAGVLANDSDANGDTLTAVQVSGPAHGSLTLNSDGSFSYTPAANWNGSDSFTYQAYDGHLYSDTATVTLNVNAVNDAPVAVNDSGYTTAEDTTLSISVAELLANDTDVDLDTLTVASVSNAVNGSAAIVGDSVEFTPAPNYNGPASFDYTITDGHGGTATAKVSIDVTPVNDAPVAQNDSYTVDQDSTLNVPAVAGVLANDSDIDSAAITAVWVSDPAHGTLTLNADGSFTYTPAADYYGPDSFTYQANDGSADSNVATVSIIVRPAANVAPVAADDPYSGNEDSAIIGNVLTNDSDLNGDSLTAVKVSGPAHGTLTLNSNGSFTYTPDANWNGSDGFTYQAYDGELYSNTATVTLNVSAVNDAPVAADDAFSGNEDSAITGNVLTNDSDVEGDTLTVMLLDSGMAHGSVAMNPDGSFTYTPEANWNGTDKFSYRVYDGTDLSNVATVSITILPVNDAPVAQNDSYTVDQDTVLNVPAAGVLINDSDIDSAAITAVLVSGPAHGSLSLNDDGSFTYTPAAGYYGADSFTYQANDGAANSNVATVSLTVQSLLNEAPVAVNDSASGNEDSEITGNVLTNDSDANGDTLTAIQVSGPVHGSLTLNTDGNFTYKPNANWNGEDSFTYQAFDGQAYSDVATVTITVNPVNDAPVAQNLNVSTAEDTPYTGSIVMTDVDSPNITASVVAGPAHGTLDLKADGGFTYTPDADFNGSDSFTYKANDGALDSNIATVTITVTPVNDAPVATNDSYTTDEDVALTIPAAGALANDSDVDGDTLNAILVDGPSHGTLDLKADGGFTYTPNANWNGVDSFSYKANDGALDSNIATVTITVTPVNDAPVATNDSYTTDEDVALTIPAAGALANDSDVDGDTLNAILVDGPSHGTLVLNANGSFTYTPDANWNGVDSFSYKANDGSLDSNVATVTITVTPVNDAPVAQSFSLSGNEGTPISGNLLAHVTDVDSISLSASLVGGPAHGSVILNANGSFSYTPNFGYSGADSFTYKANDGELDSNTATVNLTVNPLSFRVIGVEQSPSEFKISFNHALDASVLNLYDAQSIHMGSADLTLAVGTTPVSGSMVIDASHGIVTFIKTGGVLAAGSYNLTLRSALDGFKDTAGNLLDGNADGTAGDNYSGSFSVSAPAQAVLSIPDFVRGPGQTVNVPATGSGIPIRLSNATGIGAITFTLKYDPALLNITNVAMLQSCSSFTSSNINGVLTVTIEGLSATGAVDLVKLTADVPGTAPYRDKQVLDLTVVSVNGGSVTADDGLEVVAYLGDTSGNKIITTNDMQLLSRVLVRNDSGFGAFATVDPAVIGDINGNGAVDVVDGSWIGQEANWYTTGKAAFNRAEIPDLPAGVVAEEPVGPDPFVSIPTSMTAQQGDLIEVPINVDPADGLSSAQIYLGYDTSVLELVEVQKGSLTQGFNMFIYGANDGVLKIDLSGVNPVSSGNGSIAVALFRVKGLPASGTTSLDLQWVNLNDGQLVLTPAPVAGADPTDGRITFHAQEDVLSRNTVISIGSSASGPTIVEKQAPKEEPAKLVKWELPESGQVYSHAIPQDSQGTAPNWVKDFVVSLADYDKDPNSHIRVQVPAAKADAEAQVDEVLQLSRLTENTIDTLEIFW